MKKKYKVSIETEIEVDSSNPDEEYSNVLYSFAGDIAAFEIGQIEFPAGYKVKIEEVK